MGLIKSVIYATSLFILILIVYLVIRPGALFGEGKFYKTWYNNEKEFINFDIIKGFKGYKIYQSKNNETKKDCLLWIGGGGFLYTHNTPSFFEYILEQNKQVAIITTTYPTIRKTSFKTTLDFFKHLIETQIRGKFENLYIVGASAGAYITRYLFSIDNLFTNINVKHLFFIYGYYGPDYQLTRDKNFDKLLEICGVIYLNYKTFKPISIPKTVYCGDIDIFYNHNKNFAKIEGAEFIEYPNIGHGWSQCLNLNASTETIKHIVDTIKSYKN